MGCLIAHETAVSCSPRTRTVHPLRAGETGQLVCIPLGSGVRVLLRCFHDFLKVLSHHSNSIQNFRHLTFHRWCRNGWVKEFLGVVEGKDVLYWWSKPSSICSAPSLTYSTTKASPFMQGVFSSDR